MWSTRNDLWLYRRAQYSSLAFKTWLAWIRSGSICSTSWDNLDKLGQPLIIVQFTIHLMFIIKLICSLYDNNAGHGHGVMRNTSRMADMALRVIPSIVIDF